MNIASKTISHNIIEIREAIGLTQGNFALLCQISRPTLSNIEGKNGTPTISTLQKIANFTGIGIEKLTSSSFTVQHDLREKLTNKYAHILSKSVILKEIPSIPYIVKFKLLKTSFFDTPRERKEIITYIKVNFGWDIVPNTLTTNLSRMGNILNITLHPSKKGTYVYSKKQT